VLISLWNHYVRFLSAIFQQTVSNRNFKKNLFAECGHRYILIGNPLITSVQTIYFIHGVVDEMGRTDTNGIISVTYRKQKRSFCFVCLLIAAK